MIPSSGGWACLLTPFRWLWSICPLSASGPSLSWATMPFVPCCGGMGDSKGPLLYVAVAAAANIALDLLFVGPLGSGRCGGGDGHRLCAGSLLFHCPVLPAPQRVSPLTQQGGPSSQASAVGSILRHRLPTAVQLSVVNLSYLAVTGLFNAWRNRLCRGGPAWVSSSTPSPPCPAGLWGQAVTTMAGQCMAAEPRPCRPNGTVGPGPRVGRLRATAALIVLTAPGLIALFDPAPAVVAAGTLYLRICCSLNFLAYAAMYLFDSFATGVGYPGLAHGQRPPALRGHAPGALLAVGPGHGRRLCRTVLGRDARPLSGRLDRRRLFPPRQVAGMQARLILPSHTFSFPQWNNLTRTVKNKTTP